MVYKKSTYVNWDPIEKCVLANEQVIDGKGWRSGANIEKKLMSQWFLKITKYAEDLEKSLKDLKFWPEQVKTMQKNWIGKSKGLRINFSLDNKKKNIEVFTTRTRHFIWSIIYCSCIRTSNFKRVCKKK